MKRWMELTELQIDALKEIANIGAGHAATALSQLLNTTIKLRAPRAEILPFHDLNERVAEDRSYAMLHVYVRGEVPSHLVVLLDNADAHAFVRAFLKRMSGEFQIFESIVDSTLKELGNIVAASYLSAIVQLTGANMVPSLPTLSYGSLPALLEMLKPLSSDPEIFLVESTFLDRGMKVSGHLILIPEAGSLEALLSAFGVN